jgi:hypothetical protein
VIAGLVVAPDGTPVAGAEVSIQEATPAFGLTFSFSSPQALTTGAGTFTLADVRAGKYVVTASREGYAQARSEAFDVSGAVRGLLLELRRGTTLKGHVLGLELDEISSLALNAFHQGSGMQRGQVDFSAEYAFDNLTAGHWMIQAQVAGSGRSSTIQVEIPEGATEVEKDIEFGVGFALTGIVLDGDQPLVSANIAAAGLSSSGSGITGPDGRFRIENLKAGSHQVMVMAGSGILHMQAFELTGDQELRIELSTGTVSGILRDAVDGQPLAGGAVVLQRSNLGADSGQQFDFGNRAESDSRGYFSVSKVRQGSWRVVATKPGYAPGETMVAVDGNGAAEVEIRMTATEGVSFEVALESGSMVPTVQAAVLDLAGRQLASGSYSVIEGRIRISTVPSGPWELVIQGGDSAATRFAVTSPGDLGRLVLPTGGTLHIRVPELEQVPMATITLTDPDGRPFVSMVGISFGLGKWVMAAGQAMIPSLSPGTWTFTIEHDDRTWSGSAAVTPGAPTQLTLP